MIRDASVLEAYLSDLLNSMPDASFLVNSTGGLVLVNGLIEKLFELPRNQNWAPGVWWCTVARRPYAQESGFSDTYYNNNHGAGDTVFIGPDPNAGLGPFPFPPMFDITVVSISMPGQVNVTGCP